VSNDARKPSKKETEIQRTQIERMSTEQISGRVKQNQHEIDMFLEQIFTRASLQEYSENQYNELVELLKEAKSIITECTVPQDLEEKRREWMEKASTLE
jgi:hypothetical protein